MSLKSKAVLKSINHLDLEDLRKLHHRFSSPIARLDCGGKCAPHNPRGKPFCCDIGHAVPAAYICEWNYFREHTDLWRRYRGNECAGEASTGAELKAGLPKSMILLACLGPDRCQREYRSLSCRQFPFFPYVTSDHRFMGMACEWEFEDCCWVVSNLQRVTHAYRVEFMRTYDSLFALFQDVFEDYIHHSERLRECYRRKSRRFALLHRNGGYYLVSPNTERLRRIHPSSLQRYGVFGERSITTRNLK